VTAIGSDIALGPDDVARLRRSAYRSQRRRVAGRRVPILFVGGPLEGVQITVSTFDASNRRLGFAVPTDRGVVQALYERGDGSRGLFVRLDGGVRGCFVHRCPEPTFGYQTGQFLGYSCCWPDLNHREKRSGNLWSLLSPLPPWVTPSGSLYQFL
jgi:hypothetical protein